MTGGDLGYKPGVVEQDKFQYSPLVKFFNKELEMEVKKERLLRRLKNIECKNEDKLETVKDQRAKKLDATKT